MKNSIRVIRKFVLDSLFPPVPAATGVPSGEWTRENLAQSGISLRNTLLASAITAIGFVAAVAVAVELTGQTKAANAATDAQAIISGVQNAYGADGGYPSAANFNFSTLQSENDFPNDGTPNGTSATFGWGTVTYATAGQAGQFQLTFTPNTAAECNNIATGVAGLADTLTVAGTSIVAPGVSAEQSIPAKCAGGAAIVFNGG